MQTVDDPVGPDDPPPPIQFRKVTNYTPLGTSRWNHRKARERVRLLLAITFALCFLFTLVAGFVGAFVADKWLHVQPWLEIMLPAETALFGAAMGFYFGQTNLSDDE